MSTATAIRLIIEDEPLDGATNMARDEVLLEQADRHGGATLRWYRWSPATLSLGYFQDDSPDVLPNTPRVRRLSGGGAILHNNEWTYSLAGPRAALGDALRLYAVMHAAIVEVLVQYEVPAAMRGVDQAELNAAFLCFERGDRHDIILQQGSMTGCKVVGSAQRRRGRAVLQHGSTHYDLTTPGFTRSDQTDVSERRIDERLSFIEFVQSVTSVLQHGGDFSFAKSDWSEHERVVADHWARQKYSTCSWGRELRRGPTEIPQPFL